MRARMAFGVLVVALATAGCGGSEEPEKEDPPPMKVEETVFRDLVGTQDKARDGANASVELHRESLEKRLDADEGAAPDEDAPPEE